jgi:diguanylate cyclase (GGDEF)-like protein/PAS domain S-box-containing protein
MRGWIFSRPPKAALLRAFSDMGEGMAVLRRGRLVDANPAFAALAGRSRAELLALGSALKAVAPEEREMVAGRLGRGRLAAPGAARFPSVLLTADGRRVAVEMAVWRPAPDARWEVMAVRDVSSERRAASRRVLTATVPRVLGDALTFDTAAPRLLRIIGESMEMRGGEVWLLEPGGRAMSRRATWWEPDFDTAPEPILRDLEGAAAGLPARIWAAAAPVILPDLAGDPTWLDPAVARPPGLGAAIGVPIFIEDRVVGVIDLFSAGPLAVEPALVEALGDIGRQVGRFLERRRAERNLEQTVARLTELAASDSLTGLRNRREFDRLLATVPRQRFAVFAIDVDNLKQINDSHGHEEGDRMLRSVGRALAACVRGWDVVARTGGDEFASLMVDVDAAEAASAAERMRQAVRNIPVTTGAARISVGWSVGTAGADPREVARLADVHLYEAKRAGRDRVSGGTVDGRGGLGGGPDWEIRSRGAPSGEGTGAVNPSPVPSPEEKQMRAIAVRSTPVRPTPGEVRIRGRRSPAHPALP